MLYAIKVRKADLALIALLNSGVTPKVEKKSTYFIFDATWNSYFVPQIITEQALAKTYDFKTVAPILLALKR